MPTLFNRTVGSVQSVESELGVLVFSNITFTLQCTYTQNAADNTTAETLTLRATSDNQRAPFRVTNWSITGNGGTNSGSERNQSNASRTLGSVTRTLRHNLSGGLTFSSGAKVTVEHWLAGGKTSTTLTLSNKSYAFPSIDVYADLSFSDNNPFMGSTITIDISKPAVATATKVYAVYEGIETLIYDGDRTNFTYSILDFATSVPDSQTATIQIYSQAYNDDYIYNAKSYNLVVNVPLSYVPAVAIGTITDQYNYGQFIRGYSNLTVPITGSTTGNATITKYEIEIRQTDGSGQLIADDSLETASSSVAFEMDTPITAITVYIKATITDSRGRSNTAEQTITAVAYVEPQISLSATRCDANGTTNPVGNYINVTAIWSITQIGAHNILTEQIKTYLSTNRGSFTLVNSKTETGYAGMYSFVTALSSAAVGTLYATIKDTISERVISSYKAIPKTDIPISLYDDGSNIGVTIGGIASEGGFNVLLPTRFKLNGELQNALNDYVVEQGTSGNWTYRKWASGIAECWGKFTVNTRLATAWGSLYTGATHLTQQNYPFTFVDVPMELASVTGTSGSAWQVTEANYPNTATHSAEYTLVRTTTTNNTNRDYYVNLDVKGRWK